MRDLLPVSLARCRFPTAIHKRHACPSCSPRPSPRLHNTHYLPELTQTGAYHQNSLHPRMHSDNTPTYAQNDAAAHIHTSQNHTHLSTPMYARIHTQRKKCFAREILKTVFFRGAKVCRPMHVLSLLQRDCDGEAEEEATIRKSTGPQIM